MSNTSGPPKRGFCRAPGQPLHPSTRRTGYCDTHHAEYQKARSAHNSRVSKAANENRAVDDDGWEDRIEFSPVTDAWTALSPADRHALRQASLALAAAAARLVPITASEEAFFDTPAPEVMERLGLLLEAIHGTQKVIGPLGDEPAS